MRTQRGGMKKQDKNRQLPQILFCMVLFGTLTLVCLPVFSSEGGVTGQIKSATAKLDPNAQVQTDILMPRNVVQTKEPYQGGNFYTLSRKDKISRFKCSACHSDKEVMIKNAGKISHAEIKVQHGGTDGPSDCNTCHDKTDRDYLMSAKGAKIDIDHVYDMCGQCHFRQKKDWIGGAHGKRVTFWAGQRVVENCTSCHNPHSPRFEKRMPTTYSVPLK